jgi:hypothetical protein
VSTGVDLNKALDHRSLPIQAKLVCNEEFRSDVLQKGIDCATTVADTSELFLRSVQLLQVAERSPGR